MYLPACLISQTGGLSTTSPLTALRRSGSLVAETFLSVTVVPSTEHRTIRHDLVDERDFLGDMERRVEEERDEVET
jgi:hypothetical protein